MTLAPPEVHLDAGSLARQMAHDVHDGLSSRPLTLPPKYFYDAHGSELFDQITRLPEYYPTRTERAILEAHVEEIAALTGARTLVELGSGTSEKTRLLLDTLRGAGTLQRFVPFDVDPAVLELASVAISAEMPEVAVTPVVGDFERHLGQLGLAGGDSPCLLAFLGSTIGNLDPAQRASFLAGVRSALTRDDAFLLGLDLVKDPERLVDAYDDAQGVTAAFNKNVLSVINRQLDADADLSCFEHVARWVPEHEWIEMRLRSTIEQRLHVRALDLEVFLERGEEIRTEISSKFRREGIAAELAAAGLDLEHWWTDPAGDFALLLARPV
ncbi:L-histidine N(alpha)-methyltransferase [Nocardioides nanhaiensis]|uniref:L-histidine N(Alpha)-methyltransferase n=1 Tax=Nocardioides nanhaiensis TaxID=1476871 RepID=A0ABP8X2H0_9ACTN